jgi:DNA (cytosine-5)-methyltransferase 1
MTATAEHRPATRKRRFAHDELTAVDLFSGFGGLTKGIETAGFTAISCANHSKFKIDVHEANHPNAEHWIADLVDTESAAYHSVRDLPAADLLAAGVSCVNHSQANTKKPTSRACLSSTWKTPTSTRVSPAPKRTGPPPTAFCTTPHSIIPA